VNNIRILGKTERLDFLDFAEEGADGILINLEGQVTNEQCVALGADRVSELLSAVIGAGVGCLSLSRTGLGGIKVQCPTLELKAIHLLKGSFGILMSLELNISETTRALHGLVGDDTSTLDAFKVLEGLIEAVVGNTPTEISGKQGCVLVGRGGLVGLGLLDRSSDFLFSLALLGGFGLHLSLFGVI
jgi:hypothetical protein